MYSKKKRLFAVIACAVIIFVTVFSFFYIAKEAKHDCSGQDCQICISIQNAENIIKKNSSGKAFVFVAMVLSVFWTNFSALANNLSVFIRESLTDRKIRLNN